MAIGHRTYASYERGERIPDATALVPLVEEGWNANWLLAGHGPERLEDLHGPPPEITGDQIADASQFLSDANLTIAIELAEKAIGDGYLPLPRRAKLVRLLYQGVTQGLPFADVLQLGRTAADKLAQSKGDDGDVGELDVGRGGKAAAG